ncbi:hypothetical protein MYU51_007337 [Penicillium brevicompactum]|uniref:uncharacterized protein n=1 Tax=Penicillium brevicompactum TaxID=5074 RepID=UPI0025410CEE|nr:uncharacterized protein N7506_006071 [Penicillium brevicompactum]KAJ5332288.1 hypothetical protein N7506_006071 [Penicillium brevicompactum]
MFLANIVVFAVATVARTAPVVEQGLNSIRWTPEHILQPDEVILFGEGRMEIVSQSVYNDMVAAEGYPLTAPEIEEASLSSADNSSSEIAARASCDMTIATVIDKTETFIDWDVQMSPVVAGAGSGLEVSVDMGYSVSNSVSVSAGLDSTLISNGLSASTGVSYTREWTTDTAISIKGTVPDGYHGAMITKPYKTRRSGRVLKGCIGSQTQTGTFSADSYQEESHNGVEWVSGSITLCMKKEFPLTRCTGGGTFI